MNLGINDSTIASNSTKSKVITGQRRSNIEIIADMLRIGENGAGKTEIMYTANMSYSQIQKYLNYLVGQGFINKVNIDGTMTAYQVTDSGFKLLKTIDSLMDMLNCIASGWGFVCGISVYKSFQDVGDFADAVDAVRLSPAKNGPPAKRKPQLKPK